MQIRLLPFLLAWLVALPASAQNFINFGKPLAEVSATADSRSAGVEASFTFILHGGLSAYKLKDRPLAGPDTGYRVDLGFGLGDELRRFEAFHFSMGYSFVSDPDRTRDHRVNGIGLFTQADLTLGAHVLVGVYGLLPLARGQDFGTVGLRLGWRLPPYR